MAEEVPWFPPSLREYAESVDDLRQNWCYVVLEEVVDQTALLLRWPWPLCDAKGRLFWPADDQDRVVEVGIPLLILARQLYRRRPRRSPHVGDTFATKWTDGAAWPDAVTVDDSAQPLAGPVLDISADARAAAKLAYQGSLVPPLPKSQMDEALVRRSTQERLRTSARPVLSPSSPAGEGSEEAR